MFAAARWLRPGWLSGSAHCAGWPVWPGLPILCLKSRGWSPAWAASFPVAASWKLPFPSFRCWGCRESYLQSDISRGGCWQGEGSSWRLLTFLRPILPYFLWEYAGRYWHLFRQWLFRVGYNRNTGRVRYLRGNRRQRRGLIWWVRWHCEIWHRNSWKAWTCWCLSDNWCHILICRARLFLQFLFWLLW